MATYKVIQDVEAEDKLVGPLTLRQFIYAAIAGLCGWLSVVSYMKGVPFMLILLVPTSLLSGFLAIPWGGDQPTEIWAVSKLLFFLKPRKRIWNQDGQNDLVSITVPKRIQRNYTDGLSQNEVKSRLSALAQTLDTRGWALQNQPGQNNNAQPDRLFGVSTSLPKPIVSSDVKAREDILDARANPTANHLNQLVEHAEQVQRDKLMAQLNSTTPQTQEFSKPDAPTWFGPREQTNPLNPINSPGLTSMDESNVSVDINTSQKAQQTQATTDKEAAIIDLAGNNDYNIATLSRQADQANASRLSADDDEVIVPLR